MDNDCTDLLQAQRYAAAIFDAQARYMDGLQKASDEYATQLMRLRIRHDADMAQAREQRGW